MPSTFRSNTYSPYCKRSSYGYYKNDSGILTKQSPYIWRPNFIYENESYKLNGYLNEEQATNIAPSSNYLDWYTKLLNYNNDIQAYTITEIDMLGPTNELMPCYEVSINKIETSGHEVKIPVSGNLNRMAGNPVWSFFIKKDDSITETTNIALGVPGQSLQYFDMNTLDWAPGFNYNDPTFAWNLYAGREQYCNDWVRIGIGGYCNAGGVVYNASFYFNDDNNPISSTMKFYMCLPCAVQNEPKPNYMSSYIDPGIIRMSD